MFNLNRVELLGNIAADPEIRSTATGKVCNLRIATSKSWKDKQSGDLKTKAAFHPLTVWNPQLIDFIDKHVRKGAYMYVQAELEHATAGEDDDKRYFTNIIVKQLQFAEPKDVEGPANNQEI